MRARDMKQGSDLSAASQSLMLELFPSYMQPSAASFTAFRCYLANRIDYATEKEKRARSAA